MIIRVRVHDPIGNLIMDRTYDHHEQVSMDLRQSGMIGGAVVGHIEVLRYDHKTGEWNAGTSL